MKIYLRRRPGTELYEYSLTPITDNDNHKFLPELMSMASQFIHRQCAGDNRPVVDVLPDVQAKSQGYMRFEVVGRHLTYIMYLSGEDSNNAIELCRGGVLRVFKYIPEVLYIKFVNSAPVEPKPTREQLVEEYVTLKAQRRMTDAHDCTSTLEEFKSLYRNGCPNTAELAYCDLEALVQQLKE